MRVLIADANRNVRSALRLLLEDGADGSTIAEVASSNDLLSQAEAMPPDMIIVDWELPGKRLADTLPALRLFNPSMRIVALSGRPEVGKATLEAGADYFINKGEPPAQLLQVLDQVRSASGPSARGNT